MKPALSSCVLTPGKLQPPVSTNNPVPILAYLVAKDHTLKGQRPHTESSSIAHSSTVSHSSEIEEKWVWLRKSTDMVDDKCKVWRDFLIPITWPRPPFPLGPHKFSCPSVYTPSLSSRPHFQLS